jgi:hypothetical protein
MPYQRIAFLPPKAFAAPRGISRFLSRFSRREIPLGTPACPPRHRGVAQTGINMIVGEWSGKVLPQRDGEFPLPTL